MESRIKVVLKARNRAVGAEMRIKMNENGTKRREWVKNAAIVFLTVMLILTFFSNTIMNYSLPEVAAQYVQSGTITAKIRGTGTIESSDPYNVMVKESRKVMSVAVHEGDVVQKGDVLLYLDESESEELKAAKELLETATENYEKALLSADVTASVLNNTNSNIPTTTYRQQITNMQNVVEAAQNEVKRLQEEYNNYATQIAVTPSNDADYEDEEEAYDNAKAAKESADFALVAAKNNYDAIEAQLDYENSVSAGDATKVNQLGQQLNAAQVAVNNAQAVANNAALAFSKAETALNNKKAEGDTSDTLESLKQQQASIGAQLDEAERKLTAEQENLTKLISNVNQTLNLESLYSDIAKAQEEVDKQMETTANSTIVAEVAGTVNKVNVIAGETTDAATPVVVLQPEGKGYTMSFSVTNDQAKRLAVGDRAEIVNSWRYDDVEVTLSSIKPDKTEPGQKKMLTFDVVGEVVAGQSLSISVGQKSANYDLIVPNSAIREDNNGKFILIVESKPGPLNNRYIATRVDVEVIASDDTQSAISAALYGYEFVITTSTQPVEAGKQVRLADN